MIAGKLAARMNGLRASEIREILKVTAQPEVISFAGGLPAPELFPVDDLLQVSTQVLQQEGRSVLQYSTSEGDAPLRSLLAQRMNHKLGTGVEPSGLLVTCGSQQALDLTGKLLLDEGDMVVCESPTYLGAIQAFRAYQPRFVEVPTDDDGMLPDELERLLGTLDSGRIKLIYVVPDFQNPSGRCWSLARRQALLEVARRHDLVIVEDGPYAELRFAGEPVPPLKALDRDDRVVFLGTCSKIFCPGIRIGWIAAPTPLLERYVLAKQGADLHTSTLSQRLLAVYLDRCDIEANIELICDTYRSRRDVMLRALDHEMPPGVTYTRPDGGLFLWLTLPAHLDARQILTECVKQKVAFVPGGSFFPNGGHENTLRLNFSNMPPQRIVEGVRRLAGVLRRTLASDCEQPPVAPSRYPPADGSEQLAQPVACSPRL